jgi:hypothetical protein
VLPSRGHAHGVVETARRLHTEILGKDSSTILNERPVSLVLNIGYLGSYLC